MNHKVIPIAVQEVVNTKERKRQAPKGRRVDPAALAEVRELLGDESRQADLLIEHLHKIQDKFGHLASSHLAALAQEMRLAQTEVYEVASFYHHFDIVKEGGVAPQALTVRVCDGLSCEMAGAKDLLAKLPKILGKEVRVIAAPCVGRCEQAPVAVVGQNPIINATCEAVQTAVEKKEIVQAEGTITDFNAYQNEGGYALLKKCVSGERDVESVIKTMEDSGLRGLGLSLIHI